ncbi:hypothetical protein CPLU01_00247 [Colletotrichum plurivorum]|uniref:Uncharacterized protein n=1 Tax=Colletotrichum plurivorum TaxID=2175906 RepID=A0A8H6NTL9_9PEZI|nr:hypothetical protein CPLU01_00247 [Colletotrichum plurivorum]
MLMHTINSSPHTLPPGPLSLQPTPPIFASSQGPKSPIILSVKGDHCWPSLNAPQLGHPSPVCQPIPSPILVWEPLGEQRYAHHGLPLSADVCWVRTQCS